MLQNVCGDVLKSIAGLGHSGYAYQAAKVRIERKYRRQRWKIFLDIDELKHFKPIQNKNPKEIEKVADLVYIPLTNLKEPKHEGELGNGKFFL